MLRRIFSENPALYTIYYHLIRKHQGLRPPYFTSSTDIYYDGYPRSGNTFLSQLIKNLFSELEGVHHLHKVAPIKIALRNDLPIFILIRDPKEAISSNYLKYYASGGKIPEEVNIRLLSRLTDDYFCYYNFVSKNMGRVQIIRFEELINSSVGIVKKIADRLDISLGDHHSVENRVREAADSYSGAQTKYGSSKPNMYKEQEKDKIKEELPYIDNYEKVIEIYNEITN